MISPAEITVIVPYHNESPTIEKTLSSINLQTAQPSQVIFVNSSSTDDSSQLVDDFIESHELQSRFQNLNCGTNTPGGSKRAGVERASTAYVAFMDCGLSFPLDWLELQVRALNDHPEQHWVSGVCRTTGEGLVDRSAIAHTYGFRRCRPVMPSSLLPRAIFDRVGHFADLRAGYDAQWIKDAARTGPVRLVNNQVVVRYEGTNFAPSIGKVFKKSELYAFASTYRPRYVVPKAYLLLSLFSIAIGAWTPAAIPVLVGLYVMARLLVATIKSRRNTVWFLPPHRLVVLIATGLALDLGKLVGSTRGILSQLVSHHR